MKKPFLIFFLLFITPGILYCQVNNDRVILDKITKRNNQKIPYSAGITIGHVEETSTYYTHNHGYMIFSSLPRAGAFVRWDFTQRLDFDFSRIFVQADLNYRKISLGSQYVSIGASTFIDIPPGIGFFAGLSVDTLVGYGQSSTDSDYHMINKDCLNRFIPSFKFGYTYRILELSYEVPLNSGYINLERYTYYNRAKLTFNRYATLTISLRFRLFGSSHIK